MEQECIFLVTVHEEGTELWIFIVIKVLVLRNIQHLHVNCHERFPPVGRHSGVTIKQLLRISVL